MGTHISINKLTRQLFPPPAKIPATEEESITPPMRYTFLILSGRPGSGKTTLALTIASLAEQYYKNFEVKTVYGNDIKTVFDQANAEIVNIIVDDADVEHPSRKLDSVLLLYLNRFRHILARQGVRYGIIMFVTHRWKQLLKDIRSFANMVIFKSIFLDPADNEEIVDFIGKDMFYYLRDITRKVFRDFQVEYNKFFVYRTSWGDQGLGVAPRLIPQNLVIARKERVSDVEELARRPAYDVEDIIEALAMRGWAWHRVLKHALPVLRIMGYTIGTDRAYQVWRNSIGVTREEKAPEAENKLEENKVGHANEMVT